MSTVIGIDLGTSTTEAAVIQNGKPLMIFNLEHEIITPSAVGINESGDFVVGEKARAQYLLSPENTAIEVKRKIGTNEKITLNKQPYTPVELSAKLLEYVKAYASDYLKTDVTRAVISVPAYFDDLQRQATVEAGTKAGLEVMRILNEPTAAALSYGLEHMEEESHILVYDLGGGTFDVTLLEMFDGVLEVKASSGDNQLGGKDFDEKIMHWLISEFQSKHDIDLTKDKFAMVKLKEAAENCKKALSTEPAYQIVIPMIAEKSGEPLALDETITVEAFEEMTKELIERTHPPIDVVLADSGILAADIDRVILVGGSTRMPLVAKDIENYLHMEPAQAVNPDYAVAEGAAIQAGIIEGSIHQEDSIIITDVNPYTLGIRVVDDFSMDRMAVVIPRNVTIPVTRSETYFTSSDFQTVAHIEVYQGESRSASRNHFLGDFEIHGIPSKKARAERINVEFSYNLNGMLSVKATIASTGADASIEINMMQEQAAQEEMIDVSKWKDAPHAKDFRTIIRRAERLLKDPRIQKDKFLSDDLEGAIYDLKEALILKDLDLAKVCESDLLYLLDELSDES
ncbi:MAG: Hsp70 family protein [Eubacterium sp.]|nr:Hsp70 family protein [Eubacterium sp.]